MGRRRCKNPVDVRTDTFAMRVNAEERHMLVALAERLQRSQSDTVRLLIRQAARELEQHDSLPPTDAGDPFPGQLSLTHL
jgi:hypothetical protein